MEVGGVDDLLLHSVGAGSLPGEVNEAVGAKCLENAGLMYGLYALHVQDAVFVLHEFCQQVHDFHQPRLGLVVDHEVVAGLVVRGDSHYVAVFEQEELVPMQLHELQQLQPFFF